MEMIAVPLVIVVALIMLPIASRLCEWMFGSAAAEEIGAWRLTARQGEYVHMLYVFEEQLDWYGDSEVGFIARRLQCPNPSRTTIVGM